MLTPHPLEWTPARIKAFWDHQCSNPDLQYFSASFGRSLIAYVARRIRIGIPLDYGCGRGHLLAYLAERCPQVIGVDQSPESQEAAAERVGRKAHVSSHVEPESVDTAFMVEVVEHMDDRSLETALIEIFKALKPGGHLVITTPNQEDLRASEVLCTSCGATFHLMQHVRSWDRINLAKYAESRGFQTVSSEATILSIYSGLIDRLWRTAKLSLGSRPNLIYIGRKHSPSASH